MARILGIDYGSKRIGIAVTDPLQIIVQGLATIDRNRIWEYLREYISDNKVELIVLGEPVNWNGEPSDNHRDVMRFKQKLKKRFPNVRIELQDERFSSVEAKKIVIQNTRKKERRQNKGLIDKTSSVIILQRYLGHI